MSNILLELQAILPRLEALQVRVGKPITVSCAVKRCTLTCTGFSSFMADCLERHFVNGEEGEKFGEECDHFFPFPDEKMEHGNPDPIINSLVIRDSDNLDTIPTFIGGELLDLPDILRTISRAGNG